MSSPTLTALREHTSALHREVEAVAPMARFPDSRRAYAVQLKAMWDVLQLLEKTFYVSDEWKRALPDHAKRLRAHLIAEDLRDLEFAMTTEMPAAVDPRIDNFARGMGAAYVLEGSTLGGIVLARRLREKFGDAVPTRFFSAYGNEVGGMWKIFCAALEKNVEEAGREAACASAVATFGVLKKRFAEESAALETA